MVEFLEAALLLVALMASLPFIVLFAFFVCEPPAGPPLHGYNKHGEWVALNLLERLRLFFVGPREGKPQ